MKLKGDIRLKVEEFRAREFYLLDKEHKIMMRFCECNLCRNESDTTCIDVSFTLFRYVRSCIGDEWADCSC